MPPMANRIAQDGGVEEVPTSEVQKGDLLLVRPGLTGPPVTNDDEWSAEEQAIQDVAYVRDYSLWLDLRLLFASLMRVLRWERALPASYQWSSAEEALLTETATR